MQSWFVYYKIEPATRQAIDSCVRRMQQDLGAATGVRTRLMHRVDAGEKMITLLEVYDDITDPSGFGLALSASVGRSGLPAALVAGRRTEKFEDSMYVLSATLSDPGAAAPGRAPSGGR